jgi:hypothetical protein
MTAQVHERLRYQGEDHHMCSEPLGDYLEISSWEAMFMPVHTALWRAYIGSWEIVNDRLYLVGIEAKYENGKPVTLDSLFPGFSDRVFAHWYSGTLLVPQGDRLRYVHMGYASTYERDLMLEFDSGVLQRSWVIDNTHSERNRDLARRSSPDASATQAKAAGGKA